jgi:prepilin-type N-terminal cleavage/methylation domain-containing protein
MKRNNKKNKGFTIIEMMIAIAIFLIVITMGVGALLNANLVHRKSQDMRSIMDNLNFTMEDMSRNIRTGYHYACVRPNDNLNSIFFTNPPQNCQNGWGIAFISADGAQWVYYISGGKIHKAIGDLNNDVQLTLGDEVDINASHSGFTVIGTELPPSNDQQPFVTIRLNGTITYQGTATPFSIQTSVSQRNI